LAYCLWLRPSVDGSPLLVREPSSTPRLVSTLSIKKFVTRRHALRWIKAANHQLQDVLLFLHCWSLAMRAEVEYRAVADPWHVRANQRGEPDSGGASKGNTPSKFRNNLTAGVLPVPSHVAHEAF